MAILCQFVLHLSAVVSPVLFPKTFSNMNRFTQLNWHIHTVSHFHAILILYLAIPVLSDANLNSDHIYGYSHDGGVLVATTCGYFLWDVLICLRYVNKFGIGFVLHGASALTVMSLGLQPYLMYFGARFLMVELSTPFLNHHWWMDKLSLTGSKLQLVNGIVLMALFFASRIIWCPYVSYYLWKAVLSEYSIGKLHIPLVVAYLSSNIAVNALNFMWLSQMYRALRKRFVPKDANGTASKSDEKLTNGNSIESKKNI
ncbi:DUF887-domain-containing protein [Ramicandelaber brevisporus]|nr:DUF887-domain-containing protein [Ramicandelaber brevisporus]